VRVISPDKLKVVSPSARAKERFIIVDAVGVCEHDKTDSHTLNRKPSATLEELLNYVAHGGTDPDALTTLGGRLARLQREFSRSSLGANKPRRGTSFPDLAHGLLNACDPDAQMAAAKSAPGVVGEPTNEQVQQAASSWLRPPLRRSLKLPFVGASFEIRQQNEQTIDRHTIDDVLYSGFDAAAVEKAHSKVKDFRVWIAAHKDELTALQVVYAGTRPLKISLNDLRKLKDALARPPLSATPTQIWRAFEASEVRKAAEASPARRREETPWPTSFNLCARHPADGRTTQILR